MKKIVIISGPTCSGKNAVVEEFLHGQVGKKFEETVSCTTRSPREREEHGRHYHFISVDKFEEKIKQGEMLEWAKVHGDLYYGTEKAEAERIEAKGKNILMNIDVQGALQIKKIYPKAILIFINAEHLDVIKKRLVDRGHHEKEDIAKRLTSAEKEIEASKKFDFTVINREGKLEEAAKEIEKLVV